MQKVIPSLVHTAKGQRSKLGFYVPFNMVHTDQVGYTKGIYIGDGENIRKIVDIINYTSQKNVPGTLALIDFQKVFDTVEWPCLFQTLK